MNPPLLTDADMLLVALEAYADLLRVCASK